MPDKKLQDALKQLDAVDLAKMKVDDLKAVKNPVLAQVLRDFLISKDTASHHNSHFVHISHYSTMIRPGDVTIDVKPG